MKRLLLSILTSLVLIAVSLAQEMTIKNFELVPNDITASIERRNDANNQPCALLKVQLAQARAEFVGNVVGEVNYTTSEYWVYMTDNSKRLQVKLPGYLPLDVEFAAHGVGPLKSLMTYRLVILLPDTGNKKNVDGKQSFTMKVRPKNAYVKVDGKSQPLDDNGYLILRLQPGKHSYQIEAAGYEAVNKSFVLKNERFDAVEELASVMAILKVTCPTLGAAIYVNDVKREETSSWTGTLVAGSYLVEARKEGYYPRQQTVELSEKQQLTINLPALQAWEGRLNVGFKPLDAEVWIDGELKGKSPNEFGGLSVGSHKVEIRKEGHVSVTETVTIKEGETTEISGELQSEAVAAPATSIKHREYMATSYRDMDIIELQTEAEKGVPQAQYELGVRYEYGERGVQRDFKEAHKWYYRAAEQGDIFAQNNLGMMYVLGKGVPKNYTLAQEWLMKAAEKGDATAQVNLGKTYLYGDGLLVKKDYKKAMKWIRKAALQGDAEGQVLVGTMSQDGLGVEPNDKEAMKWYLKAADQGDARGQYCIGRMYDRGYVSDKIFSMKFIRNDTVAAQWYLKSAEQGYIPSQKRLALFYERGIAVKEDLEKAKYWYQQAADKGDEEAKHSLEKLLFSISKAAAEQGDPQAQMEVGKCYYEGKGTDIDFTKALEWSKKAADQGNAHACYLLGRIYRYGLGVSEDYTEAAKWFRLGAEKGDAEAQNSLGTLFEDGKGVGQDYEEALKWYRMAAEQGESYAQSNLGRFYRYGRVVEQDYKVALEWYRKSAEQGNRVGQCHLGSMYDDGLGVEQDVDEARKWYILSAQQGYPLAQLSLGLSYWISKDLDSAKYWYKKAADQGDETAKAMLEHLNKE